MHVSAFYKTGNTTPNTAQLLGNPITNWTANAARRQGTDLTLDIATGKMTATTPMTVLASAQASLETEDISGTSGDGVGVVGIALAKNGTIITGTKVLIDQAAIDLLKTVSLPPTPVELAKDDYLQVVLVANDASGNDVTVREAQFTAQRID